MKKILIGIVIASIGVLSFTTANSMMTPKKVDSDNITSGDDVEEGIQFFEGDWSEALKKADEEDKLIFLDAYAHWCGPCKMMARDTFTDKKVGKFFNENFISYKMDMEKHEDGPRLSKKFQLTAYPSLYFLDKNEEIVHFALGYHHAKDLISVGQTALDK